MSTPLAFHGPLADIMSHFVDFKRMQGYPYTTGINVMRKFDAFLSPGDCVNGVLTPDAFHRYLATTTGLAPGTREGYLSVVRQFSRYLHAHRPESAIVPPAMLPRYSKNIRFYTIGPDQVRDLMDAAILLRPKHSIRPHCIRFLIGILYSTGLRIAEALKLNLADVDMDRSTFLIRQGKFGKDRIVVMSDSTLQALHAWLERRSRYAATGMSAPLFIGGWNTRLTYRQASWAFRILCRRCGFNGKPAPRLHDLRHNFACRRIELWREAGNDVEALLPVLANIMGHVNIFATQVYIHTDAATLQQASVKFNNHVHQHSKE